MNGRTDEEMDKNKMLRWNQRNKNEPNLREQLLAIIFSFFFFNLSLPFGSLNPFLSSKRQFFILCLFWFSCSHPFASALYTSLFTIKCYFFLFVFHILFVFLSFCLVVFINILSFQFFVFLYVFSTLFSLLRSCRFSQGNFWYFFLFRIQKSQSPLGQKKIKGWFNKKRQRRRTSSTS